MATKSLTAVPSTSVGILKRHEKMLDTIRLGTENEAIALFSDGGCDVNTKVEYTFDDRKKYLVTPLAWAVRYKRPQLCRYLLENGADPYSTLIYDYYPLHEACNRGFNDIVKIFIDMKCDINRVTSDNHSPLHIACMRGNIECARLLLDSGANRNVRNNNGRNPLELGIYHGQSDLQQLFSYYSGDAKPRIQRRHSLHSPTGEPRSMKQLSSFDMGISHRPQSMLIDFSEDQAGSKPSGIDELTLRTLQITNENKTRSQSNQNLASDNGVFQSSFVAPTHTCSGLFAPTTTQLQVSLAPINPVVSISSGSMPSSRPNLMKQFSQASSCAADSPSPVERDGVLSSGVSPLKNDSTTKPVQMQYRTETDGDLITSASGGNVPEKSSTTQYFLGATLKSSVQCRSKAAPSHSNSNPEFPLTAHISMNQTERTQSFDDLYENQCPPFRAHPNPKVSPSREKINSLSSQIYSSLDQNWPSTLSAVTGSYQHILKDSCSPTEANPICDVMQKIINITTPLLNLNQAHIHTLMQLSSSCRNGQDFLHSAVTTPCSFAEEDIVYDSPVAYLLSLGYRMVEKPLTVMFGVPCEGYMTLTFRLVDESIQNKDAVLKIVTKIFDLKNKHDSSTYHCSIVEERPVPSLFSVSPQQQEIKLLSHLGQLPHPNIVEMTTSFRGNTNEQHEVFAQQMNPDKPKKMYTTGRIADFMILQSPRVHLKTHLNTLMKTKKALRNSDVFPETMVLSVLSQVLLAAGHLIYNEIAHCAVSSSNIFIDGRNNIQVVLSNFSHAVQLNCRKQSIEEIRLTQLRLKADIDSNMCNRHCVLSPEVVEAIDNSELESAFTQGRLNKLFAKNDCYGAAWMIYSWFLNKSHSFVCQDRVKHYSYSEIPYLSEFSPQCNHLLKKLVAYNSEERLPPMKAAMACFVLIFGPAITDIKTEEECYKWLLAETVEFYMRPVLVDSKVKDYTDSLSKLLCLYLTVASANPRGVWDACRFFSEF